MAEKRDMLDDIIDIQNDWNAVKNPLGNVADQIMADPADVPSYNPSDYKDRPRVVATSCLRHDAGGKDVCHRCLDVCPVKAIELDDKGVKIQDNCRKCGLCIAACPTEALLAQRQMPKALYDKIARMASTYEQVYVTCTRALGRLPKENEILLPCVGVVSRETWFALLSEYGNISVYLPLGICDKCRTTTGEEAFSDAIADAEDHTEEHIGLEVDEKEMNHEQSLLYIRILCLTIAIIILLITILIILYRRKLDKQRAELTEKTSYINGVETERKRLAKELHDGVCNDILAVNIMMQTDKEAAERLLKNVGNDVRRLSHELIPPRFDNASLSELVCTYCLSMSAENGTIVKPFVSRSFEKLNLPSRTALEVYRIVQESVSNAIKYGYSKMITVTLDASNNQASLCIANDISPEHPITQGKMGIGKDTLKMRTEALKAVLTISEQDEEYKVEVRFPL